MANAFGLVGFTMKVGGVQRRTCSVPTLFLLFCLLPVTAFISLIALERVWVKECLPSRRLKMLMKQFWYGGDRGDHKRCIIRRYGVLYR